MSIWAIPDSPLRLERLRTLVRAEPGPLSLGTFERALADHANFPSAICSHPDTRYHPLEQAASVASILMELDSRRMWVADGHPCTAPYRELDYGEFLSKPSPVRRQPEPVG